VTQEENSHQLFNNYKIFILNKMKNVHINAHVTEKLFIFYGN